VGKKTHAEECMGTIIEALLNEREVAELLKVSVATIRRRRLFQQPPEWVKIGASVRYRPETIKLLVESAEQSIVPKIERGARRNAR
jgi:hypothetical protein